MQWQASLVRAKESRGNLSDKAREQDRAEEYRKDYDQLKLQLNEALRQFGQELDRLQEVAPLIHSEIESQLNSD
jgi:hypothetical protein